MASDNPVYVTGIYAGGDLSSDQYKLMKADTTEDQVLLATAADDDVEYVLYDKPDTEGDSATVVAFTPGHTIKVKVGAAGATKGWVGTDASGLLVTKVADKDFCIGKIDATYSSGDIAEVNPMPCFLAA